MTINAGCRSISLILLAAVFIVIAGGPPAPAQSGVPWSWGPILGAITENSVALSWKTTRSVGFDFSYSLAQVYDSTGEWEETLTYTGYKGIASILLRDLLPGASYRFQLVFYEGDAIYPTDVGSFRTIESDSRSFSFATYGATASHPDRHKLVADTIFQQADVSLVIHAGGLVEYPAEDRFDNFFWAISELGRTTPCISVIGNHDRDNGLYFENLALPHGGGLSGEQWWSFDYGPVHFVGLDSTLSDLSEESAMQDQTTWLVEDLRQAQDQLIVVYSADPLYSAVYASGENERLLALWDSAFRQYGVDVIFSSAAHCYEHIYKAGIHHIISGGGGATLMSSPSSSIPGTVFRRYGLLHYVIGTIADNAMRIEVIPVATVVEDVVTLSASGRSIDTFVVNRED